MTPPPPAADASFGAPPLAGTPADVAPLPDALADLWQGLGDTGLTPDDVLLERLAPTVWPDAGVAARAGALAADWIRQVRAEDAASPLDAFLHEYQLSSAEGLAVMCLAEALLRIPDDLTAERLIADRLSGFDWGAHQGKSHSFFVNAGTWGLMLGGRLLKAPASPGDDDAGWRAALGRFTSRVTEPLARATMQQAMRVMASEFVMGETIGDALKRARKPDERTWWRSYDMLGEAALTAADAARYATDYANAVSAIAGDVASHKEPPGRARAGLSVKLSALHPRFEPAQRERVLAELTPRLMVLAEMARRAGLDLNVDAEDADRLDLTAEIFTRVRADARLAGWHGLGLVVQAYQKRAPALIDRLIVLARATGTVLPIRLVKGAYWDTEVKRAQERGLSGYPVYTSKAATDAAYLACARKLLGAPDAFYPMFATHNAHTLAALATISPQGGYEVQRLHGMGAALHQIAHKATGIPCRVYAPVGSAADLLPYLVRRLLENGANSSFVHHINDPAILPEDLAADPVATWRAERASPVAPPARLFPGRTNSAGLWLGEAATAARTEELADYGLPPVFTAQPLTAREHQTSAEAQPVLSPADRTHLIGHWRGPALAAIPEILRDAHAAHGAWDAKPVAVRAAALRATADALEADAPALRALLVHEAGKTLPDAIAEVREAVDFLRYYAGEAESLQARPARLPGPAGESNTLALHGRGVWVCVSPWNFPLAIFMGQIAAAVVTGNSVVAKPAPQTPLIAHRAVRLMHAAGVPEGVVQLVPGGPDVGAALLEAPHVAGVAFTGSTGTAKLIAQALARRDGPLVPLIAETGGINVMVADSSALVEQVARDAWFSAFGSAGQRCSALRLLLLQEEIADAVLERLRGMLADTRTAHPEQLSTDAGPVIDEAALARLEADWADLAGRYPGRTTLAPAPGPDAPPGLYYPPRLVEADRGDWPNHESFGPLLRVVRFAASELESLPERINALGYGLTLAVHTRLETTWRRLAHDVRVGNVYVNRPQTGAVVGSQPFGGEGLSGTGPKAGGPHYLLRFVSERTVSVNTAALGGDPGLFGGGGFSGGGAGLL